MSFSLKDNPLRNDAIKVFTLTLQLQAIRAGRQITAEEQQSIDRSAEGIVDLVIGAAALATAELFKEAGQRNLAEAELKAMIPSSQRNH